MRTHNKQDILSILEHPEILPRISNTGKIDINDINTAKDIFLIDEAKTKLAIIEDNGLFHFQALPAHRDNYPEFHRQVVDWVKDNTGFFKLIAQVPFLYLDVVNAALKMGWVIEGINRNSYAKDGKLYDKYYLGLELWDM